MALIIHYMFSSLSVAVLYFILNIPVFALGWMYVGRRFFLYSIAGMFIFTGTPAWIHISLPVHDKMLSAILAGIILGVGSGIILRSLGSAGGLDILSVIFLKRFSIRLGRTSVGAITLAIVFIVAAWAACVVTTRLVQRASWVMGRLKRKVDDFWLARFWLLNRSRNALTVKELRYPSLTAP